jgi:hypothetical protein
MILKLEATLIVALAQQRLHALNAIPNQDVMDRAAEP